MDTYRRIGWHLPVILAMLLGCVPLHGAEVVSGTGRSVAVLDALELKAEADASPPGPKVAAMIAEQIDVANRVQTIATDPTPATIRACLIDTVQGDTTACRWTDTRIGTGACGYADFDAAWGLACQVVTGERSPGVVDFGDGRLGFACSVTVNAQTIRVWFRVEC